MVSFVNIRTNQFWDFESWDEIINLGGLNKLLPKEEWKDIYNESACVETIRMSFVESLRGKKVEILGHIEALKLFDERNK